ncbi:CinA family protein [Brevibacterium senegalense]|uniref:CinA family protein n=1 Tax=Brevibacterium senegalense TaxID=1033736 RepID=UPI000305D4DA|nr:nicotinamide-nucleotide amidohydrolase family protein [Brevibacterium senegalense]
MTGAGGAGVLTGEDRPAGSDPLAVEAVAALRSAGFTVATCESLTAGLVAATIASVPGASAVLRGGLITYATDLKSALAGVDADLLESRGAVDGDVAMQMARGARTACGASIGLSCTGVAGPDPQDGQPVGTVHLALDREGASPVVRRLALAGDRDAIRRETVTAGLRLLLSVL